jgi:hypothetical protein
MTETTTFEIALPVKGDGTALGRANVEVTVESGYQGATADRGTVRGVCPDPDNDQGAFVYVTGIPGEAGAVPSGEVAVTLAFAGE